MITIHDLTRDVFRGVLRSVIIALHKIIAEMRLLLCARAKQLTESSPPAVKKTSVVAVSVGRTKPNRPGRIICM